MPSARFSPIPKGMTEQILGIGLGFLLGSLPFGYWLARSHGLDIRKQGSGNIGATNVGRILGKKWGYLVFALDALKGWLAVWLAGQFLQIGDDWTVGVGVVAVVGHIFSPWLNFRGGKGVATSAGVLAALCPEVLVGTAAIWGLSFAAKRIVSISSLLAAAAFPLLVIWLEPGRTALLVAAWTLAGLVWFRHRDNLRRLAAGKEGSFSGPAEKGGK